MELLHKDDIETLDMIINTCLKNNIVSARNLPDYSNIDLLNMGTNKEIYYNRFFEIIREVDIAEVRVNGYLNMTIYPLVTITQRFANEGGFKKLFKEQQEKIRIEKILLEKDLDEAKVIKWTKKTYLLSVGIVVLSFIISVIALIVAILKP